MNAIEVSDAIATRLASLAPAQVFTAPLANEVRPTGPYVVYYPAAGTPTARLLCATAARLRTTSNVICVGNTAKAAAALAARVVDLFDGWFLDGQQFVETFAGPTLSDPDMQTGYRWSVTVELTHETTRGAGGALGADGTASTDYAGLVP